MVASAEKAHDPGHGQGIGEGAVKFWSTAPVVGVANQQRRWPAMRT
jgi:hypothetical protein